MSTEAAYRQALLEELLLAHKKYHKKTGRKITSQHWMNTSKSGADYKMFWGSFADFRQEALDTVKVVDRASLEKKEVIRSRSGTFFVTAVIPGQSLHKGFWESIQVFLKVRKAELKALAMRGIVSKDEEYTPDIAKYREFIFTDVEFNDNLRALDTCNNPNAIIPLTGFNRWGNRNKDGRFARTSLIMASPKQHLRTIASTTYPHIHMTTGAMTMPDNYRPFRSGVLAKQDHIVGGLVVEIRDNRIFHVRQVQALKDGSFYDLNQKFTPKGVESARAHSIYAGDFHCGWMDPTAVSALHEQIKLYNPEYLIAGDVFDGCSISHHMARDIYKSLHHKPEHLNTLQKELQVMVSDLKGILDPYPALKFVGVRGNHEEFLTRYLDSMDRGAMSDVLNVRLPGAYLNYTRMELKQDPIESWMERFHPEFNKRIKWLTRESEFRVAGIDLSQHGDLGSNGSRGSLKSLAELGNVNLGHSHVPAIYDGLFQAGTCSIRKLPYVRGPSGHLHANIITFDPGNGEIGCRQLVISVNGMWRK